MLRFRSLKFAIAGFTLSCGAAVADPGYYVVTPYPEAGRTTIDLRYWTVKPDGRPEVVWPELGIRHGFGTRWTSELLISWIGPDLQRLRTSSLNWQNDILLTQGEWPFDLALHAQWIRDVEADFDALEFGPVWQTDIGRTQLNANLFFERRFGSAAGTTAMKLQYQLRHRWRPGLHLGMQGFSELGPWNDWAPHARQSHRIGPALFASWPLADGQQIDLQGAFLLGRTYTRPGHMFTMQARWGF